MGRTYRNEHAHADSTRAASRDRACHDAGMADDGASSGTSPTGATWSGTWLNPPPAAREEGGDLLVTAAAGSDLWRTTGYGFVRDSGHGLLRPLADGRAVEVSFRLDY